MEKYFVTANLLNLRSSPSATDSNNVITRLNNKEIVEVQDASMADWYKVICIARNSSIGGYASSKFLEKFDETNSNTINSLTPFHLTPHSSARRNNHGGYEYPLSEPGMPGIIDTSPNKVELMHQVVSFLAVDKSERYKREAGKTYCNIYAFDYCYLTNAYLPRVWWRAKAIMKLQKAEAVEPVIDVTVDEVNANGLFRWLNEWGNDFNWIRAYDLDELQTKVNEGRTGIICGCNIDPSHSGHICCVIPEKDNAIALRRDAKVICPLTSQAGLNNFQLNTAPQFRDYEWWRSNRIANFGFWYNSK